MENIKIIDENKFEETIIIPEKEEVKVQTLDDVLEEIKNCDLGIENNKAQKIICDEMIIKLTDMKSELEEKKVYLESQGVKTLLDTE